MLVSTAPSPAARRWTTDFLETLVLEGLSVVHVGHEQARVWPLGPMTCRPEPRSHAVGPSRFISVPYVNLSGIRRGSMTARYERAVVELLGQHRVDAVFTYNVEPYYRAAVARLAANGVPWFPIVLDWRWPADWPMGLKSFASGSRGVVFASAWAFDNAPIANRQLFHGGIRQDFLEDAGGQRGPIVLYTGTKAPEGGLDHLLDAWPRVRSAGAELHICGQGTHGRLAALARRDPAIRDHGLVSEGRLRELMSAAAALVNPRDPGHPDNRFNFPSKLLHYLGSGKPIVSTWTAGLSPHYAPLLHVVDPPEPASLAAAIDKVIQMSPAARAAHRARVAQFIQNGAGWLPTTKVLLEWCQSLMLGTAPVQPDRLLRASAVMKTSFLDHATDSL